MEHVNNPLSGNNCLLWLDEKVLVVWIYGQTLHGFLHGCIPTNLRLECLFCGSFALHRTLLRFGGCLYATMGGNGKILLIFWSLTSVFQCFLTIFGTLGSFGLKVRAKTGLLLRGLVTLMSAVLLSSSLTLEMKFFTTFLF